MRKKPKLSHHRWTDQFYCTLHGKRHYLGTNEKVAKQRLQQLLKGAEPEAVTVHDVVNAFMSFHESRVGSEIAEDTWISYRHACVNLLEFFGRARAVESIRPMDLTAFREMMNGKYGATTLQTRLSILRMVFAFGEQNELIRKPLKLAALKSPNAAALRKSRSKRNRVMSQAEVQRILEQSEADLDEFRTMFLFALNMAGGPADLAGLLWHHIDGEWLNYPRPKSGVDRLVWLWPETREALPQRKHVFGDASRTAIRKRMLKGLARSGSEHRPYDIRHTALTRLGQCGDSEAVRLIAGHVGKGITARVYIHEIEPERIQRASEHLRQWTFGDGGTDDVRLPRGWKLLG